MTAKTDPPKFFGVEMVGELNRWTGEQDYRCHVGDFCCECAASLVDGVPEWQALWWWQNDDCYIDSDEGIGATPEQAITACESKVRARIRELAEAVGLEVK